MNRIGPLAPQFAPNGGVIGALYTRITGRPYITVGGHASRDFGPTPGATIAQVFGAIPDDVALAHGTQLYLEAKRILRDQAAIRDAQMREVQ
ncbi:hypothetical protein GA0070616_1359 [Micromonospora nigra]|uniref:Uncharacterized protein n=1 Tax=Micromonospora nigra TaxID=145857 RepID=A0A1C6RKT6_9ACTN|nr:hypothetical protein [Micromonospora nigra]SCL17791.1 hypothetical protein GA0070616_1359 [Micromonospora nigra]